MSGFVVDFTGAAERGLRGCVLRVKIIILGNYSAISEGALFTKWSYLCLPEKVGFGVPY